MTTLRDQAATMPLTYITPTPDAVTPPGALEALYYDHFQYFAHPNHKVPANTEQVRPVLDMLPMPSQAVNEDTEPPAGDTPVSLLVEIPGLPSVATLVARYRYMQAVYTNNPTPNTHPATLTGDMLTPQEVAEKLNITERRLEEYSDLTSYGHLLAVNTENGIRYPARQIHPNIGGLIQHVPRSVVSGNNWATLFTPHVALGYVTPVEYARVSREHEAALAYAYHQFQSWVDDEAHMQAYATGSIEDSPYWDEETGTLEDDCFMRESGLA